MPLSITHNRTRSHRDSRGFTLIELLVTVAIISLISSIILSSLSAARSKSRDAQRISDLVQLRNALYSYQLDHNSVPTCGTSACFGAGFTTTLAPLVSGGYLSALPQDPINTGVYRYYYETDVQTGTAQTGAILFVSEANPATYIEAMLVGSYSLTSSALTVNQVLGGGTITSGY